MKYTTGNCPCCGAELEKEVTYNLTPQQIRILNILNRAPGRIYSTEQIVNLLYSHLPNGGPDNAASVVHLQIHRIRKVLGKDCIENVSNSGYRINIK